VEILTTPPEPRMHKDWKIRQVTSLVKEIKRRNYEQVDAQGNEVEAPPAYVEFLVPANVLVRREEPDVAWWDKKNKVWSKEGVSEAKFNPETRKLSFMTAQLTTALALVHVRNKKFLMYTFDPSNTHSSQSSVYDIPFKSWRVYAVPTLGKNVRVLEIVPRERSNANIQIGPITILLLDVRIQQTTAYTASDLFRLLKQN